MPAKFAPFVALSSVKFLLWLKKEAVSWFSFAKFNFVAYKIFESTYQKRFFISFHRRFFQRFFQRVTSSCKAEEFFEVAL